MGLDARLTASVTLRRYPINDKVVTKVLRDSGIAKLIAPSDVDWVQMSVPLIEWHNHYAIHGWFRDFAKDRGTSDGMGWFAFTMDADGLLALIKALDCALEGKPGYFTHIPENDPVYPVFVTTRDQAKWAVEVLNDPAWDYELTYSSDW